RLRSGDYAGSQDSSDTFRPPLKLKREQLRFAHSETPCRNRILRPPTRAAGSPRSIRATHSGASEVFPTRCSRASLLCEVVPVAPPSPRRADATLLWYEDRRVSQRSHEPQQVMARLRQGPNDRRLSSSPSTASTNGAHCHF